MILLVLHDVSRTKSQQNVPTIEIKINTSNKKGLENKSVLKTVNSHNDTLHVSQTITHNKL